jgi:hypothetical protein
MLAGNTLHAAGLRVAEAGCEPTPRVRFPEPKRLITGSIKCFTFHHRRKSIKAKRCNRFDVMFFMTE